METVYAVITRDTRSDYSLVEAVCASRGGAESVRKDRQTIWGKGNSLNPARYIVSVREMTLNP